jgi:hypothetical protein
LLVAVQHVRPAGIIELDGYQVEAVDDMAVQDTTPRGTDVFLLKHSNPAKRAYMLFGSQITPYRRMRMFAHVAKCAGKDKTQSDEWADAIMNEISGVNRVDAYEDWDAMEAKKQQLIEAQEGLRKQQSELRLKKVSAQYLVPSKPVW